MECDNFDAAERIATISAAELGRDRLPKGDVRAIAIEVRDENRLLLTTVTVLMSIRRTACVLTARERSRCNTNEVSQRTSRETLDLSTTSLV